MFFEQSLFLKWRLKLIRTNLKILHVLMMQFKVFWLQNFVQHLISELKEDEVNKLFLTTGQMRMIASKNKDHFTISLNCNIRVWLSFKDLFWICDNKLFLKMFRWNMFNERWVWSLPTIGLWFKLMLVLCFRLLLLFKFVIIVLTNKHFYDKINYFVVNKNNCLLHLSFY